MNTTIEFKNKKEMFLEKTEWIRWDTGEGVENEHLTLDVTIKFQMLTCEEKARVEARLKRWFKLGMEA